MFLQEAFVLIIRGLIMRCPSKEGERQWGNNVGPSLNITILKIPTRKNHAQITRCCKEEGFSPPLILFVILGYICIFSQKVLDLEIARHQAGRAWQSGIAAKFRTIYFSLCTIRAFIPMLTT